jgi:predicted XRE-type DNA-binding protein
MAAMTPRALPPALEATKSVQTPLRLRAVEARLEAAQEEYARTRQEVVHELVAQGLSYAQVAVLIGVTKSRAYQIAQGE